MKDHVLRITYCLLLIALLAACQPAPEPTPQATAELPTETPRPLPLPITRPPAPATLTPVPTRTPLPAYPGPAGTPEPMLPEAAPDLPRLGAASTLSNFILCDGRQWQWWWSTSMAKDDPTCALSPPHVPMLAWSPATFDPAAATTAAGKMEPDTWIVFNECDNSYQCATSPEDAARFYHDTLVPFAYDLDPNARLIVGGANGGLCGVQWLIDFTTYYRDSYGVDVPRAGWHFHPYADLREGAGCNGIAEWNWPVLFSIETLWQEWLNQAYYIQGFVLAHGREGDEVWFTEMGCLAPYPSVCRDYSYTLAERQLYWFDTDGRWVDRFAWFADGGAPGGRWDWTMLYYRQGGTNYARQPVGDLWLGHEPLPAIPMEIYHRYFPIMAAGADVVPGPLPLPAAPPPAYPGPVEELHP